MKNDIRKPNPCKFVIPLCDIHISDNEKSVDVWLEPDYFSDKEVFKLFDWFMRLALIRLSKGNLRKRYDKKQNEKYCAKYDSYYDPKTGEWSEEKCDDPDCVFCNNRPDKYDGSK